MAEEPGRPSPLPPEVRSGVPRLPGSPAGLPRGRAAAGPRPAVPGCWSQQQSVCGIRRRLQKRAWQGLRPGFDGKDRALRQTQRVQAPVPDHARQAALLRTPGLRPVNAGAERRRHDSLCSNGDTNEVHYNPK